MGQRWLQAASRSLPAGSHTRTAHTLETKLDVCAKNHSFTPLPPFSLPLYVLQTRPQPHSPQAQQGAGVCCCLKESRGWRHLSRSAQKKTVATVGGWGVLSQRECAQRTWWSMTDGQTHHSRQTEAVLSVNYVTALLL